MHYIWFKFIIIKNYARTAPSKGSILDEFIDQHQHQKSTISNAELSLFGAHLMQICWGIKLAWISIKILQTFFMLKSDKSIYFQ